MLTRFEVANRKRLQNCIAPNENRINRLKERLKSTVEAITTEINQIEEQVAGYRALIAELDAKEAGTQGVEGLAQVEVEEVVNPLGEFDSTGLEQLLEDRN